MMHFSSPAIKQTEL